MSGTTNESILTVGLWLFGIYFLGLTAWALWRLALFRRTRSAEVVAWSPRGSAMRQWGFGLGMLAAGLTLIGLAQLRFLLVFSQAAIALYFLLLVPLVSRIRPGLYEAGIWADGDFAAYDRISRWAFTESPEIRLLLVVRGRARALHLRVPPDLYGAVRKVLRQQIRDNRLHPDPQILDLSGQNGD
jgi:hypothetical protein